VGGCGYVKGWCAVFCTRRGSHWDSPSNLKIGLEVPQEAFEKGEGGDGKIEFQIFVVSSY